MCQKGRTLGKGYGIEEGVVGNTFGEHIDNLKNIIGNICEHKIKKSIFTPPPPKEIKSSLVYVQSSHWLHAYYILNMVLHEDIILFVMTLQEGIASCDAK
jgi:hypothetical protein